MTNSFRARNLQNDEIVARANTMSGLYPECDGDWVVCEELRNGKWERVHTMRRLPNGEWD